MSRRLSKDPKKNVTLPVVSIWPQSTSFVGLRSCAVCCRISGVKPCRSHRRCALTGRTVGGGSCRRLPGSREGPAARPRLPRQADQPVSDRAHGRPAAGQRAPAAAGRHGAAGGAAAGQHPGAVRPRRLGQCSDAASPLALGGQRRGGPDTGFGVRWRQR